MIMIALFALTVALVPIFGGRLSLLGTMPLRRVGLLYGALAIQLVIIELLPGSFAGSEALHLVSYAMGVAFLLANRSMPGMALVGLGALGNVAAIAANGGVMPASRRALETAGLTGSSEHFANSTAVADARLAFLGDVFAIPARFPLANVFSVGDVLLLVGGGLTVHVVCGSRLGRPLAKTVVDPTPVAPTVCGRVGPAGIEPATEGL